MWIDGFTHVLPGEHAMRLSSLEAVDCSPTDRQLLHLPGSAQEA
jgi:hypothetical protein